MAKGVEGAIPPSAPSAPAPKPDPIVIIRRPPGKPRSKYRSRQRAEKSASLNTISNVPKVEGNQPRRYKNDALNKEKYIRLEYNPHPKQSLVGEAVKNGAKIIMFLAGIRSGKSYGAAYECLNLIYKFKRLPNLGYIVTPTINMGRIPRRLFIQAAGNALVRYKRASDDGPPHALLRPCPTLPTHNYLVEFHSGEYPDRMRGASVAWAWLDEAAFMKPEVLDVVMGRVMENDGVILITTSPSTQSHWTTTEVYNRAAKCGQCGQFYHDHKYKREGLKLVLNDHEPVDVTGDKTIAVIQCATFDNVHLEERFVEELKQRYLLKDPIIAKRELYGEICGFEGLVYRSFDRKIHKSPYSKLKVPEGAQIIGGIDFGVNDPFVIIWACRTGDVWHILDEYYYKGPTRAFADHVDAVKRSNPLWKRTLRYWYDPSGKQGATELVRSGLAQANRILKARRQQAVGLEWRKARIDLVTSMLLAQTADGQPLLQISPTCSNLVFEMESRKWKRYMSIGEDDRVRVMDNKGKEVDRNAGDEPAPGHDHATDALEYLTFSEHIQNRYKVVTKGSGTSQAVQPVVRIPLHWQGTMAELASSLSDHATAVLKPKNKPWSMFPTWS